MFKVAFLISGNWSTGVVEYKSRDLAWRAIHEVLEETFGDNYGERELAEYDVVPA